LADVYDALTSDRVYKPALSHDVAVKMIVDGECGVFNPELLASFEKTAVQFLDPEKIKEKSVLSISSPSVQSAAPDVLLLGDTSNLTAIERSKRNALKDLTDDIILDYDIKTDTAGLSKGFRELFATEEEISGFRHFIRNLEDINKEHREQILSEVIKLDRQKPDMETVIDVKLSPEVAYTLRVYIKAIFENDEDAAPKTGYVAKIIRL
jgi:putative two-component system response regulator